MTNRNVNQKRSELKIEGHAGLKFWMQRVAEEKAKHIKKDIDRVALLSWQMFHFDEMGTDAQEGVILQLEQDMMQFGW